MVKLVTGAITILIVLGPPGVAGQQTAPAVLPGAQVPKPGNGLMLGRVVDAATGRGVAGAVVTRTPDTTALQQVELVSGGLLEDPTQAIQNLQSQTAVAIADGEGRFVFRNLSAGSYRLNTRAPGYLFGAYGQSRPNGPTRSVELTEDQKLGDVVVKMWKYASITGTVLDDTGDPAVGVTLRLLSVTTLGGRRRLAASNSISTDDRGVYRFSSVIPGNYVVSFVMPTATFPTSVVDAYNDAMNSGNRDAMTGMINSFAATGVFPDTGIRAGDVQVSYQSLGLGRGFVPPPPSSDGRWTTYQPIFYPTATTASQAGTITVASGEERAGVDLRLKLVPAVRVSGTLTGPEGPAAGVGLRLFPGTSEEGADPGLEIAVALAAADGSFAFVGVPAGQYTLRAQRVPRSPVSSANTISTVIQSGTGTISMGTSVGTGGAPVLPKDSTLSAETTITVGDADIRSLAIAMSAGPRISGHVEFQGATAPPPPERLAQMGVSLTRVDGQFISGLTTARLNADGSFATMSYPQGRYNLNVSMPAPWTLKSIVVGGRDALTTPLDLTGGDLTSVVVTFTDTGTEISGTVNATASSTADAQVVVFPADLQRWLDGGSAARRARVIRTSPTGTYRLPGLPPGDYLIVAVDAETSVDLRDGTLLNVLARSAQRLTLGDGEKKTQSLSVTQVR